MISDKVNPKIIMPSIPKPEKSRPGKKARTTNGKITITTKNEEEGTCEKVFTPKASNLQPPNFQFSPKITVTSVPPSPWALEFPPNNVGPKVEKLEKELGPLETPKEKAEPNDKAYANINPSKNKEDSMIESSNIDDKAYANINHDKTNGAEDTKNPEKIEIESAARIREDQANEILKKVMGTVAPKKTKKKRKENSQKKSKSVSIEKLITKMGRNISQDLRETKEEIKTYLKEFEEKQDDKNKELAEKVSNLEEKITENNERNDNKIEQAVKHIDNTAKQMTETANEKILQMTKILEDFKERAASNEEIPKPVAVERPQMAQIVSRNIPKRDENRINPVMRNTTTQPEKEKNVPKKQKARFFNSLHERTVAFKHALE